MCFCFSFCIFFFDIFCKWWLSLCIGSIISFLFFKGFNFLFKELCFFDFLKLFFIFNVILFLLVMFDDIELKLLLVFVLFRECLNFVFFFGIGCVYCNFFLFVLILDIKYLLKFFMNLGLDEMSMFMLFWLFELLEVELKLVIFWVS